MIAVVTGASGFFGRNLVHRLLSRGAEVRCLVRAGGGRAPAGAAAFPVDYSDQDTLNRCHAFDGADAVFHLAGVTRATGYARFDAGNVAPARAVLRAIVEKRAGPRFIHVSSQSAAGPAPLDRPSVEEDEPRPVEAYGRSKLAAERVVEGFSDRVATTIVRPCAVYGPWDRGFYALFRLAAMGWLVYPGVRDHWMSVLHVEDVVDALLSAARERAAINRTYFLSSVEPVTWGEFGAAVASALGTRPKSVSVSLSLVRAASVIGEWVGAATGTAPILCRSRAQLAAQARWVCSAERAAREIAFRPTRTLTDGVRDTYLWYVGQRWLPAARVAAPSIS